MDVQPVPNPSPPPELSPRDREWLTLYLDLNEDLHALSTRLASPPLDTSTPGHLDTSLVALASWLRTPPIRAALADWDYAQRRARAARDEADRRIAIDALKAACLGWTTGTAATSAAASSPAHLSESRASGSESRPGDLTSSPAHSAAGNPPERQDASAVPADQLALVEMRRSATALLRAISRSTQHPARSTSHRHAGPRAHPLTRSRAHRFNLGPEAAERFLERERRENDRLEKLIQQALAVSAASRADDWGSVPPGDGAPVPSAPLPLGPSAPSPRNDLPATAAERRVLESLHPGRGRAAGLAARAGHAFADTG